MCYILISKQIAEPNNQVERLIRSLLKNQMDRNDDGFFFKNGKDVLRTLDPKIALKTSVEANLDGLMAHFRMASIGKVNLDNVHGWEVGDWTFFHNGGSSTYTEDWGKSREQDHTDSYLLFQDLWLVLEENQKNFKDSVVCKVISDLLSRIAFWGRAALYNSKTDKMYLFGDFRSYVLGGSYLVLSSCKIDWDEKYSKSFHGIKTEYPSSFSVGETTLDGIGVISRFSTPTFSYRNLQEKFETKTRTYPTYSTPATKWEQGMTWDPVAKEWKKPVQPPLHGLSPIILPGDRELTPEQQQISDNILNAKEELEDLELDLTMIPYRRETYTEEKLQRLFDDETFIGWDQAGNEMYIDQYGIHDKTGYCCQSGTCWDFTDMHSFILKEDVITKSK